MTKVLLKDFKLSVHEEHIGNVVEDGHWDVVYTRTSGIDEFNEDVAIAMDAPRVVEKAVRRYVDAAGDLVKIVGTVASGKTDVGKAVDTILTSKQGALRDANESDQARSVQVQKEGGVGANNMTDGTVEQAQTVMGELVDGSSDALGGSNVNADGTQKTTVVYLGAQDPMMQTPEGTLVNKNAAAGITDTGGNVGINLGKANLEDGAKAAGLATHEAAHRAGFDEAMSGVMQEITESVWNRENSKAGVTSGGSLSQGDWLKDQFTQPAQVSAVLKGNEWASGVKEGEAFVPQLIGAGVGAGLDYGTQVVINRLEGKGWKDSLINVDQTSIAISAGAGAIGVGLAGAADDALRVVNLGKASKAAVTVGTYAGIDAGVSAGSQYAKDGEVDPISVGIDVGAGIYR